MAAAFLSLPTRNFGGASGNSELPSSRQLIIADFDNNGRSDLFIHSPAPSARLVCAAVPFQGTVWLTFEIQHANVDLAAFPEAVPSFCYCGPHYDTMIAPPPPPSPPKPPPSPEEPPQPPPIPSP